MTAALEGLVKMGERRREWMVIVRPGTCGREAWSRQINISVWPQGDEKLHAWDAFLSGSVAFKWVFSVKWSAKDRVQEMFSSQEISVTYWGHNWVLNTHMHTHKQLYRQDLWECFMHESFIVTVIKWGGLPACLWLVDWLWRLVEHTCTVQRSSGPHTARCWFYIYYIHWDAFTSNVSLAMLSAFACCALH